MRKTVSMPSDSMRDLDDDDRAIRRLSRRVIDENRHRGARSPTEALDAALDEFREDAPSARGAKSGACAVS